MLRPRLVSAPVRTLNRRNFSKNLYTFSPFRIRFACFAGGFALASALGGVGLCYEIWDAVSSVDNSIASLSNRIGDVKELESRVASLEKQLGAVQK